MKLICTLFCLGALDVEAHSFPRPKERDIAVIFAGDWAMARIERFITDDERSYVLLRYTIDGKAYRFSDDTWEELGIYEIKGNRMIKTYLRHHHRDSTIKEAFENRIVHRASYTIKEVSENRIVLVWDETCDEFTIEKRK